MSTSFADLLSLPALNEFATVAIRLSFAILLGGILGAERAMAGKAAGLRTHMLVSLGAAAFVLFAADAGMTVADASRVVQGVATGIGFIGAGAILKRSDPEEVHGLTTAAGLWVTAAIGSAVGLGHLWFPVVCSIAAWLVLRLLPPLERAIEGKDRRS
jgi:putative Mg2+ transporter-C (MgtC) family protein